MSITLSLLALFASQTTQPTDPIVAPPAALSYGGFYTKCAYLRGLPIIGSPKVDDKAFRVLVATFDRMLAKCPVDPIPTLVAAKSHYSIIAESEGQTDLPEYASMKDDPKTDWNKRARGLGGLNTSGGEENILERPKDRYKGESIYIHEFAHTLADYAFVTTDKAFSDDLKKAYRNAMNTGLWKDTYSTTNPSEYWAEGVQMYFDCARSAPKANGVHNEIYNRVTLMNYDKPLYDLVDRTFGGNPWRYEGSYNTTNKKNP